MAIGLRGRPHGDVDDRRLFDGFGQARRKRKRAPAVSRQQLRLVILVNGSLAGIQRRNLLFVDVDARDLMTQLGQTGRYH